MFDKQVEKKLMQTLQNINPKKLEKLKGVLASQDANKILETIDVEKVQNKIHDLQLDEVGTAADLETLVRKLKENPSVINDLKNKI